MVCDDLLYEIISKIESIHYYFFILPTVSERVRYFTEMFLIRNQKKLCILPCELKNIVNLIIKKEDTDHIIWLSKILSQLTSMQNDVKFIPIISKCIAENYANLTLQFIRSVHQHIQYSKYYAIDSRCLYTLFKSCQHKKIIYYIHINQLKGHEYIHILNISLDTYQFEITKWIMEQKRCHIDWHKKINGVYDLEDLYAKMEYLSDIMYSQTLEDCLQDLQAIIYSS